MQVTSEKMMNSNERKFIHEVLGFVLLDRLTQRSDLSCEVQQGIHFTFFGRMNNDDNRPAYGEKAADFSQSVEFLIQKSNS